jgi:hypothetical protein
MTTPAEAEPKGQGLADDLIGSDPIPDDARRFDPDGYPPGENPDELDGEPANDGATR